ncbi:hypothetical protein CK507_00610 [Pseudomonas sp. WN033]|nr:hypothetical protein CK507_00610 [Pseudomonas sp. WN033]
MNTLTVLAPLSSWLVMMYLGAQAKAQAGHPAARQGPAFYGVHYVAPLLVILLMHRFGLVELSHSLGLALCVLAGTGTSAVPWALRDGASAAAISARLAVGAMVALVTLPLVALAFAAPEDALQRLGITALVMAGVMWLPWQLGRFATAKGWLSPRGLSMLGKAATLSVVALIVLVAWRELPRLPEQPGLLAACLVLVMVQGMGGALLDARTGLATTAVIRNLTLATVVIVTSSSAADAMTALAAFGTLMYLGVWPTSQLASLLLRRVGVGATGQARPED